MTIMQKQLYCSHCQTVKTHDVTVTGGDYVFIDPECGRFVKFAVSTEDLAKAIADHKTANEGLQLVKTEEDQVEVGGMTKAEVDAALARLAAIS